MIKEVKKKKCLIDGCKNIPDKYGCRGLCHYHYSMVRKLVKEKKRTWEEFEEVGMALPPRRGRSSFTRVLFNKMLDKKFNKK